MARPEYTSVLAKDGVKLYSPSGELIISSRKVYGSKELLYRDHVGLGLPDEKIGNNHDKLMREAANAHERMTTTRWQRVRWSVGEVLGSLVLWSAIAAVAATIAAVGAFM